MSESAIALKANKVDEIVDKIKAAKAAVVVDLRGLTVEQNTNLRNQLREEGISLEVIKNNILRRAAEKAGLDDLKDLFVGPSAVAFSNEDEIAPSRILKDFSKTAEALELKGGVVNGEVADLDTINRYAALPSREALLGQLMAEFQFPLRSFMYAVKAVAEKREAEGETAPAPAVQAPTAEEKPAEEVTESEAVAQDAASNDQETVKEEQLAEAQAENAENATEGGADNA